MILIKNQFFYPMFKGIVYFILCVFSLTEVERQLAAKYQIKEYIEYKQDFINLTDEHIQELIDKTNEQIKEITNYFDDLKVIYSIFMEEIKNLDDIKIKRVDEEENKTSFSSDEAVKTGKLEKQFDNDIKERMEYFKGIQGKISSAGSFVYLFENCEEVSD